MIRKEQITDPKVWNLMIDTASTYTCILEGKAEANELFKTQQISLAEVSFFNAGPKNISFTTKYGPSWLKARTYIFTLDGTEASCISGGESLASLKQCISKEKFKVIPDLSEDPVLCTYIGKFEGKFINRQSGILYSNPNFKDKKVYGYCYDINSAYLTQMLYKIPRTDYYKGFNRIVGENEVGFIFGDKLVLCEPGCFAEVIFDVIDSPNTLKNWATRWYQRKKDKSSPYYAKAKVVINSAIGCLQYTNPYLRAYIVEKCNKYIKDLIDSDTIHCNTDCIISTKKLSLPISTNIGEWSYDEGWITLRNEFDYESDWKVVHRGLNTNEILYRLEGFKIYELS